jgi:hypothetical protein
MNEQLMVKYKGRYRSYFRLAESESSTASQRLQPYWAHIVSIAIVAGTPMNAPGNPQMKLQKNTANNARSGEIARVAPARDNPSAGPVLPRTDGDGHAQQLKPPSRTLKFLLRV